MCNKKESARFKQKISKIYIDYWYSATQALTLVTPAILTLLMIFAMMNDMPSSDLQFWICLGFIVLFVIGSLVYATVRTMIDYFGRKSGKGVCGDLPAKDKMNEDSSANMSEPSPHSKKLHAFFGVMVLTVFLVNTLFMDVKLRSATAVGEINQKLTSFVSELVDAQPRVWCMGFTSNYDNEIERKAALAKCEKAVKSEQIPHEVILPNKDVVNFFENATMENKVKEMTRSNVEG